MPYQYPLYRDLSAQILDSLTVVVAVIDSNGVICAVNEAWSRFARENGGTPERTGIGVNYLDVCNSVRGADCACAQSARLGIERVLEGESDVFLFEYPCHSPVKMRWFLLYVSRLMGNPNYVVTAHLSITKRKLVENQLVEAERIAAVGEAMQGLSHRGRNALQKAQAHIDLLKSRIESDEESLRLIERIEFAQQNLLDQYEEVRSYAAPIVLARQWVSLSGLIKDVLKDVASKTPRLMLSIEPESVVTECHVDPDSIRQVINSVIDNAISSGATTVQVSFESGQIRGRSAMTVVVSDDGIGVENEKREKLFEPFYTTQIDGTGLGLANSRRLIGAHGGEIKFGAPRLGGASVYISLPLESD